MRRRVRDSILGYEAGNAEGRPVPMTPPAVERLGELRVPTLVLLRPHLAAIRARWGRPPRVQGLTSREHDVLILIRDGLTNKEVAQRLVISSTTVRTQIEHIFEKRDVHTRAAAARALDRR